MGYRGLRRIGYYRYPDWAIGIALLTPSPVIPSPFRKGEMIFLVIVIPGRRSVVASSWLYSCRPLRARGDFSLRRGDDFAVSLIRFARYKAAEDVHPPLLTATARQAPTTWRRFVRALRTTNAQIDRSGA